jgi:hypothetical protein
MTTGTARSTVADRTSASRLSLWTIRSDPGRSRPGGVDHPLGIRPSSYRTGTKQSIAVTRKDGALRLRFADQPPMKPTSESETRFSATVVDAKVIPSARLPLALFYNL